MSRWWNWRGCQNAAVTLLFLLLSAPASGEALFVTIHKVNGTQMLIAKDALGGGGVRGRGMRGGEANATARGRGFRGGVATAKAITVNVPASAKITSAMRERRTFEFRVLAEVPGGLRHRVFRSMQKPLQARIVTKNSVITEVNVITGGTDINQTASATDGQTVIAVRPKRPPMKQKP